VAPQGTEVAGERKGIWTVGPAAGFLGSNTASSSSAPPGRALREWTVALKLQRACPVSMEHSELFQSPHSCAQTGSESPQENVGLPARGGSRVDLGWPSGGQAFVGTWQWTREGMLLVYLS
jgi:hypothetical protein